MQVRKAVDVYFRIYEFNVTKGREKNNCVFLLKRMDAKEE